MKIINEKRQKYLENYNKTKNKDSFDKLILSYIPNAENIIAKYEGKGLEHDEMLSIAIEAIIHCITKLNYKNMFTLSSLINRYINTYIKFELERIDCKSISYEQYASCHKNGEENSKTDRFDKNIIDKMTVEDFLSVLTERQKRIIILKYGLHDNEEHENVKLAERLGITRQAVEDFEKKSIERIKRKRLTKEN